MKLDDSNHITMKNILNRYNTMNSDDMEEMEEYLVINIHSAS